MCGFQGGENKTKVDCTEQLEREMDAVKDMMSGLLKI